MFTRQRAIRGSILILIAVVVWLSMLNPGPATAGGLIAYEVGTADVGLASAGYGARAQDASTVFTNPAGMTRLTGTQFLASGQVLWGNTKFSIGSGTSPGLGSEDGGLCGRVRRVVPRRRRVPQLQRVARPQARVCAHRQLRRPPELRRRLGRPLLRAEDDAARHLASCPRSPTR